MDKRIRRSESFTRLSWLPLLATICCFAIMGCERVPDDLTKGEAAQIEAAVREALSAFEKAERDRDVDALLAHLDASFYMYQDGHRIDFDTIVEQIRSTVPTLQEFKPSFEDVEVIVISRDAALVTMVFRDEITDAQGETTSMWGPTTFLWRLRGSKWKIAYADSDHYPVE